MPDQQNMSVHYPEVHPGTYMSVMASAGALLVSMDLINDGVIETYLANREVSAQINGTEQRACEITSDGDSENTAEVQTCTEISQLQTTAEHWNSSTVAIEGTIALVMAGFGAAFFKQYKQARAARRTAQ